MQLNELPTFISKIFSSAFRRFRVSTPAPQPPDIQAMRVLPWVNDRGDKTLRLNYNLNNESVVFDLGGYEGQWASDIFAKYACHIYIFEPFSLYAENIKQRFALNPKIKVFDYGIAGSNHTAQLNINGDSSSTFQPGQTFAEIKLVSFKDFFLDHSIDVIDLMKINIEGGEYDILDYLLTSGLIRKIKNIQVQFHDFVPDAESRMLSIQQKLTLTHKLTYQYLFVWENWTLIA